MGYTRGFRRLGWVIIVIGTIPLTTLIVVSEGVAKADRTVETFLVLLLMVALALFVVVQGGISLLAWVIPWVTRGFKE